MVDKETGDTPAPDKVSAPAIAVFCVGSTLMLDDGLGPAVYQEMQVYDCEPPVDFFDVGCMSLDYLNAVEKYDLIITVDALDGTESDPGTIFRFDPDDMARRSPGTQSLHDLKLSDLFDSAILLGYTARGVCLGMQVQNSSPAQVTVGLTPPVYEKLADLVDCVLAELVGAGVQVTERETGELVEPGFHHTLKSDG